MCAITVVDIAPDEFARNETELRTLLSTGAVTPHIDAVYPLAWPHAPVIGAEEVHRIFRGWLAELGHEAYSSSDWPGSSTRASTSGASSAS